MRKKIQFNVAVEADVPVYECSICARVEHWKPDQLTKHPKDGWQCNGSTAPPGWTRVEAPEPERDTHMVCPKCGIGFLDAIREIFAAGGDPDTPLLDHE
jgi:hypothetical protein